MTTLLKDVFVSHQAIEALITGIEKWQSKSDGYENFELDMGAFGRGHFAYAIGSICYGSTDTVTLQELVGYIFPPDTYSDKYFETRYDRAVKAYHKAFLNNKLSKDFDTLDIARFGFAMDHFTFGDISSVYEYFNEPTPKIVPDWKINKTNIRKELQKIKEFHKKVYTYGEYLLNLKEDKHNDKN